MIVETFERNCSRSDTHDPHVWYNGYAQKQICGGIRETSELCPKCKSTPLPENAPSYYGGVCRRCWFGNAHPDYPLAG